MLGYVRINKEQSQTPDPSLEVPANHSSLVAHMYHHSQKLTDSSNPQAK